MNTRKLLTLSLNPALLVALLPITSGCVLHARAAIRPPRAVIVTADIPAPPSGTGVVGSTHRTSGTVAVGSSHRTNGTVAAGSPQSSSGTVTASTETAANSSSAANTTGSGVALGRAQSIYEIAVPAPPPEPPRNRIVAPPAPRVGYLWVEGHFVRVNARWVWQRAQWVTARAGQVWVSPRYDRTRGVFVRGHWETLQARDEDRYRPLPVPDPAPSMTAPRVSTDVRTNASASASFNVNVRANVNH